MMLNKWGLYILLAVVSLCSAGEWKGNVCSQIDEADVVSDMQSSCLFSNICEDKVIADPNVPVSVALYDFGVRIDVASKGESKLKKWNKEVFASHFQDRINHDFETVIHQSVCPCIGESHRRLAFLQRLNI